MKHQGIAEIVALIKEHYFWINKREASIAEDSVFSSQVKIKELKQSLFVKSQEDLIEDTWAMSNLKSWGNCFKDEEGKQKEED